MLEVGGKKLRNFQLVHKLTNKLHWQAYLVLRIRNTPPLG